MTAPERLRNLDESVRAFAHCIRSLSGRLFLAKLDEQWTPRDVTAHLIGWNRHTLEGSRQIRTGQQPFYFANPGDDFSKVNAVSVGKYNSRNARELVDQLETSAQELERFLLSLDPAELEADYGVRYRGGSVTIGNTVDALVDDYVLHRRQIEDWATTTRRELGSKEDSLKG